MAKAEEYRPASLATVSSSDIDIDIPTIEAIRAYNSKYLITFLIFNHILHFPSYLIDLLKGCQYSLIFLSGRL